MTLAGFGPAALQEFVIHWLMCTTLMKEAEEFSEIVKEFRAREDYQQLLQVSLPPNIDKNLVLQQPLGGGGGG